MIREVIISSIWRNGSADWKATGEFAQASLDRRCCGTDAGERPGDQMTPGGIWTGAAGVSHVVDRYAALSR